MKQPVYVPLNLHMWNNVAVKNPLLPSQKRIDPLVEFGDAFMPAFFSLDELRKHYPDSPYYTLEIDTKEHG